MKKGQVAEGIIERVEYPGKGILLVEGREVAVKYTVPGQKVRISVSKVRKGTCEGRLLDVLSPSLLEVTADCPHFGSCGGCSYRNLPYEEQLKIKETQVLSLLDPFLKEGHFEGIKGSPVTQGYRNKMEFSFGDEVKDGPLSLGLHKRGSFYDIVTVSECQIVDEDFRKILTCVLAFARSSGLSYYHKRTHLGYFRHLLVRKAARTGEILIDLVTSSQDALSEQTQDGSETLPFAELVRSLTGLPLQGRIAGILHTTNDSPADVIRNDRTDVLYGTDFFYEELLGLRFLITPFSFFQTNSYGAEVLYQTVREYVGETKDKVIFDLYSGTGTIAQILSPVAKQVTGVEIVPEAVEAARSNAERSGLLNCTFLCGDVLKVLDELPGKPDLIVLDPPRDGLHPKALEKILAYGVDRLIYISCKPTSLVRDLKVFLSWGYVLTRSCAVDLFPGVEHVEVIAALDRREDHSLPKVS